MWIYRRAQARKTNRTLTAVRSHDFFSLLRITRNRQMQTDISKYIVGWDTAPPKGDRCAMTIMLTQAQYIATRRAMLPPGYDEGQKILEEIKSLQDEFRCEYPDAVCSVVIYHGKNARTEGPPTQDPKETNQ